VLDKREYVVRAGIGAVNDDLAGLNPPFIGSAPSI